MSNLPQNPKPQYQEEGEDIIIEKSAKVREEIYISKLLKIIKENNKLEEKVRNEQG